MLDSIRKRTNSLISTFLVLLTAGVMALWGVDKINDDDRSTGGAAAWVNGEAISKREFAQEYEMKLGQYQAMLGGQFDDRFLGALQIPQRTLDELIQFKLLSQQADKIGVKVPDDELADHIRAIPAFQKDGRFDKEAYQKMPYRGLEEKRQRERLLLGKFQRYIVERVRLTPEELRRNYQVRETKADLQYAKIDFEALASQQVKPSAREIDEFLKTAPIANLEKYYTDHKKDYSEAAQVELKQIRIGVPFQAAEAKKQESKKKIEDITKGITPESFAEVARKHSDDEYAKNGGAVGWVKRGTLEQALETALDKIEPGKISPIVETTFGYYVLLVTNKKDAVAKKFEDVKKDVGQALLTQEQKKKFIDQKKEAWEKMLAEGKSIEAELKKLKIEVKKTGSFSLGSGYIPNIGQSDSMVDAVFNLTLESPLPKKLFPQAESFYFLRLVSLEKPKEEEFSKQAEVIEKSTTTALQGEVLNQWISALQKASTVKTELRFRGEGQGVPSIDM